MPSDERDTALTAWIEEPMERFRSVLAATAEQVRGFLDSHHATGETVPDALADELGLFGSSRIDVTRLRAIVGEEATVDPVALDRVRAGYELLTTLLHAGRDPFRLEVGAGESLRDAVAARLAELGRAFGAARVIELTRLGRYDDDEHGRFLHRFPFTRWNHQERDVAPPLAIVVAGSAFLPWGLTEFLDGQVRFGLRVDGDCAPAAAVRLVTPGTLVWQGGEEEPLPDTSDWDGPAVAAVVPSGAARFQFDPRVGDPVVDVRDVPERAGLAWVAGRSPAQQQDELRHLVALSRPRAVEQDLVGVADPANPADKLAAWLLRQARPDTG